MLSGATIEAARNQRGSSTVYLTMKTFVLALLLAGLTGCAAPVPPPAASPSPTAPPTTSPSVTPALSPSPSAKPAIAFTCYRDAAPTPRSPGYLPSSYCPAEEVAVEAAVSGVGYPVKGITIRPFGFGCGGPFPSGIYACPADRGLAPSGPPTAFVTFVGTAKVAAVIIARQRGGSAVGASVVAFVVPPAGWSMP